MLLKHFSSFLGPLTLYLATINALTISSDTSMNNGDITEDITIKKGIHLSLENGNIETIEHSLDVKGTIYIGDTNRDDTELQATFSGPSIQNSGSVIVDGRDLASGSLSVNFGGTSIVNKGKLYFNGPNSNSNSFNLNPTSSLENTGLITIGQDKDSGYSSTVHIKSGSITNDGTICLKNVKAYLDSSISGNGCITIGNNTVYAIQSKRKYGTLGPQTLYMTSPSSIIYVDGAGLTDNILVRGFGGGNYLSFGTTIMTHSYNPDTGILSFTIFMFITHNFNIGKGYDSNEFILTGINNHIGVSLANNALYYRGDDPNGVPDECRSCRHGAWFPHSSSVALSSTSFFTSSATSSSTISSTISSDTTFEITTSTTTSSSTSSISSPTTTSEIASSTILSTTSTVTTAEITSSATSFTISSTLSIISEIASSTTSGFTSFISSSATTSSTTSTEATSVVTTFITSELISTTSSTSSSITTTSTTSTATTSEITSSTTSFTTSSISSSSLFSITSDIAPSTTSSTTSSITSDITSSTTPAIFSFTSSFITSVSTSSISSTPATFLNITSTTISSTSTFTTISSFNTSTTSVTTPSNTTSSSTSTISTITTSQTLHSKWNHTFDVSQSTSTDNILVSSTTMLLNIFSDVTSSIYATETQSTFSCSIETKDSTSSSKEIASSNKPVASFSETTTISSNDITSSNKETSSFSEYITSSSKLTANPSKVTTSSHKHVPLTKVTTVITTDNHVVTLTTLVPCSFSKSEQSTSKTHTSGETQASLSESANSNPATGDTSLQTTSMSIMNVKSSTQYSYANTLSESNLPSTEKASAETTKTLYVTSKQTNNPPPPFANGTSSTETFSVTTVNTLVSASLSTSTMSYVTTHSFSATTNPETYDLVYTSHTDFDLTKESQGQPEEATLTTSATSKCAPTPDVQLQTSIVTEIEESAITTKTDGQASDLSNANSINTSNVIHPTVSKTFVAPSISKSRMNNISAYTSRISLQQAVNGASQKRICHPLFSIFLLFTSMYI